MALLLGRRQGAVVGVRWSDRDGTAPTLRVVQTGQRVRARLLRAPPTTERSKRRLPWPKKVERALARHAERQEEQRAVAGGGECGGIGVPFRSWHTDRAA